MVIGTPTVLNLIPGGVMKVIHVNQVNENIEIQFRIMNGAQPFNVPEGVSCTIRGTKGDNFGYAAAVAVTAGSNIVTVTLTEQLTAVAGAGNIFELVFVGASDDMKVSTENFLLDVECAALGEDTVISDSDLAYADQVLDQLQSVGAVNAQVQQNKANIAAEITRATAAEQTLQQNINAEAAARQAADNTLQSNINAEASSRATTDASLQSQINQLVAPSGSAPSAAEVENARIGSDGTVYPTLGDAIRTQNSLLKSYLYTLRNADNVGSTPEFTIAQGGLHSSTGAVTTNSKRCYTSAILAGSGGIYVTSISGDLDFTIFEHTGAGAPSTNFVQVLSPNHKKEQYATVAPGNYVRILIAKINNNEDVTPSEIEDDIVVINYASPYDRINAADANIDELTVSIKEITPEVYFTNKILCPDFSETMGRRTFEKKKNVFKAINASSAANANSYTVLISGTEYKAEQISPLNIAPTANQLVDIGYLKTDDIKRKAVLDYYIDGSYAGTSSSGLYIYYCKKIEDTITVLQIDQIEGLRLANRKGFTRYIFDGTIPDDATHFVIGLLTARNSIEFTIVLEFNHAIVSSDDDKKTVTATVYGYDKPYSAAAKFGLSDSYISMFETARNAWMSEYSGDAQKIPFILHTDQHGQITSATKGYFDLISYMVNWEEVSAIFNLGDTVNDHWSDSTITTNPLNRNSELENLLLNTVNIPKNKEINVFGNHDTWYSGNEETDVYFTLPSLKYLNPYFRTSGLRTVRLPDNSGNMVVYDDKNKVRYVVIADWDYADRSSPGYNNFFINPAHWQWIINELAKNEGYDIVVVSHVPVKTYGTGSYNPVTEEDYSENTPVYISSGNSYAENVFAARKAKASGTITVNSQEIPYDFTQCEDKILCCISGHMHKDAVARAGGLLTVCFDRFGPTYRQIHLGIIDRAGEKLKVWKVMGGDTPTYESWEAPFDVT